MSDCNLASIPPDQWVGMEVLDWWFGGTEGIVIGVKKPRSMKMAQVRWATGSVTVDYPCSLWLVQKKGSYSV